MGLHVMILNYIYYFFTDHLSIYMYDLDTLTYTLNRGLPSTSIILIYIGSLSHST